MLSLVMCLLYMAVYWGLNNQDMLDSPNSVADTVYELLKTDEQQRQQLEQQNAKIAAIEEQLIIKNEEQRHQLDQQLKPYIPIQQEKCKFPNAILPRYFIIHAAGGYSGRKLNYKIDQSGIFAGQFDINVNETTWPVVLMLGAYNPTIWNINWTEGTKIVAIFASGYHQQMVVGVDEQLPVLISTYDNKESCGWFYLGEDDYQKVNNIAKNLFGKTIDKKNYQHDKGRFLLGNPLNQQQITENKTHPRTTKLELEDAIAKKQIRLATKRDIFAWEQETGKNGPKFYEGRLVYVILKPFILPTELYGANSVVFMIPKGVPYPQGNPGHSDIYDFNSRRCVGHGCYRH